MQALQVCEESGTDLAQRVLKETRKSKKDAASRSGQSAVSLASGAPLEIDLPYHRMCPGPLADSSSTHEQRKKSRSWGFRFGRPMCCRRMNSLELVIPSFLG